MLKKNKKNGVSCRLALAGAMVACSVGASQAAVIINIYETTAGDLRFEGNGGTLNTSALNLLNDNTTLPFTGLAVTTSNGSARTGLGVVGFGAGGIGANSLDNYGGSTGSILETPSSGWTTGTIRGALTNYVSGDTFLFWDSSSTASGTYFGGGIDYVDGNSFDGVSDLIGGSLATAGLAANESYTITWGSGLTADSVTFITTSPVPEPGVATLCLLGVGLLAIRRNRR